ncbi:MAG: hypothetical protein L0241_05500 [Planctomycetia bacterium]|nr:hypothetical protein [Planctomycetia bacterium]
MDQLMREFHRGKKEPQNAAMALVRLARHARSNRETAGVWRAQQCLGLAGLYYEKAGNPARAARLFERVAELARAEVVYHSKAAASASAQAARLSFLAGNGTRGVRRAEDALRFLGGHPEPGYVFEEMLKLYRGYYVARDQARRAKARKK